MYIYIYIYILQSVGSTVVNKITKPELIQLLLNTEATLGSQNAKGKFRKLESFKGS